MLLRLRLILAALDGDTLGGVKLGTLLPFAAPDGASSIGSVDSGIDYLTSQAICKIVRATADDAAFLVRTKAFSVEEESDMAGFRNDLAGHSLIRYLGCGHGDCTERMASRNSSRMP